MTKIKLCGLSRPGDIQAANELMPDYIRLSRRSSLTIWKRRRN